MLLCFSNFKIFLPNKFNKPHKSIQILNEISDATFKETKEIIYENK